MGGGDYPTLTPLELTAAGQALYGADWRRALAAALETSEADIAMVESGRCAAPEDWRAKLIALAQDMALRALEAASTLLWRDEAPIGEEPLTITQPAVHWS